MAYVTLREGEEHVQLRSYLKDLLREYMIPTVFTVLPEMPLTPNNKIDRKALPEPDRARPELNQKMARPQNEIELDLAQKWAAVLQIDQVGVDDTFFDLGGNSLLSLQLIAQLEQEMQITIPVIKFYQYPTIRLFAQYLLQNQEQAASKNLSAQRAKLQQQALAKLRHRIGKKETS
jgi:acyl carrier protein